MFAAEYFAEEVRREVHERYGEKKLYEGGLSVRTTLDPKLQVMARKALVDGLVKYDEAQGWRGRSPRSSRRRLGPKLARSSNCPTSRRGGSRSCWKPAISRRASACSRRASRAAGCARGAPGRNRAARRRALGEGGRAAPRAAGCRPA
jgi:membrane carboxypeptidase/penicillin-binding protein